MMAFPKILRIAVVPAASIIYINKTEDGSYKITGGPEGKVIEILAQALKFSYKLIPSPDGAWGNFVNGTWNGALGLVYRNEADLAISKFGISEIRRKHFDFSYPYTVEDFTFAIQKPGLRSPIDALIYPFTYKLWLAIAAVLVLMSLIFSLFHDTNFVVSMLRVFGTLTSQSVKIMDKRLRDKFVVFTWMIGALFLSFGYRAVLLSFLTIPLMEKGVENVEELSAAIQAGSHKAMVIRGSMILTSLLENKREVVQVIAKHIEKTHYNVELNRKSITEALHKEKIALIAPRDTLFYFVQNEFFMPKDSFNTHLSAIMISKSFCCRKEIDNFIHVFFASGMYRKDVNDEIFMAGLKSKSLENSDFIHKTDRSLSINDISGAFVVIIIGHTLAFIVAICEIIYFKYYTHCKKRRQLIKEHKN